LFVVHCFTAYALTGYESAANGDVVCIVRCSPHMP
jgi:hypothetical protein